MSVNVSGDTATVLIGPSGTVAGWNAGAQNLLGWTAAEAVGRSADELFGVGFSQALGQVLGKKRTPVRLSVHAQNGTAVDAELASHPCQDRDGHPLGAFLTVPARADSRRHQEDAEIIRRAMEQAPFTCVIWDLDLLGLWTNTITAESGNLKRVDELRGHPLEDAPLSRAMIESMTARMREVRRTGEPTYLVITERVRAEERALPWAIRFWPVKDDDGQLCAIAHWGVDITAEYEARQRLLLLSEGASAIGRTLDVENTARELAEALVPGFADFAAVDLFAGVFNGEEPPPGPASGTVRLQRAAQCSIADTAPTGPAPHATRVTTFAPESPVAACLATGEPQVHLISDPGPVHKYAAGPQLFADRAQWPPGLPVISDLIREEEEGLHSRIVVPLRARGALLGVAQFSRWSSPEPFTADDLVLAEDLAAKAAIAVDNARRYTREKATALTLQRSLLPHHLPQHAAVQVATRYLPVGQTGVGGDWFDVIPLSGSRVALVVGDVVGHGINAAAAMGRLRTAVRTLAAVDLPPDELLTHLDDLVIQIAESQEPGTNEVGRSGVGDLGATCLYAVYDPVTSHCTMATAAHPLPILVTPSGTVTPISGSVGPPLGTGSLPFESTELELPADSILALFSDSLIESRDHDIDHGMKALCHLLEQPVESLEALCDAVTGALVGGRSTDDVALLLARTRVFSPGQVATCDIPPDPSLVERARKWAGQQLKVWDLTEEEFVTELVVSELVTNAIRYGAPPIQLRLILDRTLTCEVSDGSSTAPHLRRARMFDEGGRGLLLVAQLTENWGTRHTTTGKTIWCEQMLTPGVPQV